MRECLLGWPEGRFTYPSGADNLLEFSAMVLRLVAISQCHDRRSHHGLAESMNHACKGAAGFVNDVQEVNEMAKAYGGCKEGREGVTARAESNIHSMAVLYRGCTCSTPAVLTVWSELSRKQ